MLQNPPTQSTSRSLDTYTICYRNTTRSDPQCFCSPDMSRPYNQALNTRKHLLWDIAELTKDYSRIFCCKCFLLTYAISFLTKVYKILRPALRQLFKDLLDTISFTMFCQHFYIFHPCNMGT